jgi:acyl carrier protein phosphodiesterase
MNYLAHLYLAGDHSGLRIGNFIADHIRGKEIQRYEGDILKGILLHRNIDAFTDAHPLVDVGVKRLHARFHKYAPVITDIFYDHYLAKNWEQYHTQPLKQFAKHAYKEMQNNVQYLPEKTQNMLIYMKKYDWLTAYSTIDGIHQALSGMAKRAKFESNMQYASEALQENYGLYEYEFSVFFADLRTFVGNEIARLEI